MSSTLEELVRLNYPLKVYFDEEDQLFVAEFFDLPGCSASGATVEEAYNGAQEAKAQWLRLTLEQGLPVPKPSMAEEYSGRILARLPSSLHAMLSDKAKLRGTSLNQYLVHLLSGAVVGDSITAKIDDLQSKIAQLELRISQLAFNLEWPQRQTSQQMIYDLYLAPSTCVSFNIPKSELVKYYGELVLPKSSQEELTGTTSTRSLPPATPHLGGGEKRTRVI